ncbi:MAG: hypothetical protein IKN43_12605 [Selenomonadaceae bacterium]|nr:hypothetical protein [Selenomonadaceae bacterium]
MKKRLLTAALILSLSSSIAGAEQNAAENYRQIFASGDFYVEYQDNYTKRVIGEKNGKRMERTVYSGAGLATAFNPLGALFGGGTTKYPEVMYKDGKFYQFQSDDKAIVCDKADLAYENLNPKEGWNGIERKLALPTELAVFFWEDPYREKNSVIGKPSATWSGKKKIEDKEYDCDRYASLITRASGKGESYYVYEMLYEKGELTIARSYVKTGDEEHLINEVKIKKISGNMPDNLFKISKKTKVYAAGKGDMDDLLENPAEVEQMEGI